MHFINTDQDYLDQHPASCLAYDLRCMVAAAFCAFDNDNIKVTMDNRGIGTVLANAEKMARELIELCEVMEHQLNKQ